MAKSGKSVSVHNDLAGIRKLLPHEYFQQSGFSCSGRTDDKHELSLIDKQIQILESLCAVIVGLVHVSKFNHS